MNSNINAQKLKKKTKYAYRKTADTLSRLAVNKCKLSYL